MVIPFHACASVTHTRTAKVPLYSLPFLYSGVPGGSSLPEVPARRISKLDGGAAETVALIGVAKSATLAPAFAGRTTCAFFGACTIVIRVSRPLLSFSINLV